MDHVPRDSKKKKTNYISIAISLNLAKLWYNKGKAGVGQLLLSTKRVQNLTEPTRTTQDITPIIPNLFMPPAPKY